MINKDLSKLSFVFYGSFLDTAIDMDDQDRLAFYDAIIKYALLGEIPNLSKDLMRLFKLAYPLIDANNERKVNGKKGGRPKKEEEKPVVIDFKTDKKTIENETIKNEETIVFENKNHRFSNSKPNVNENVNGNVNVNVEDNFNILEFTEKEFGRTLSPTEIEKILSYENLELTKYAVEQAVLSNVRNLRYIDTIIFELEQAGITTYEGAKARSSSRKTNKETKERILTFEDDENG